MEGGHPGGMMMEGQNVMPGEPNAEMARQGEQGASTTQDYNEWVAKMQAFYKQPQAAGTSNQQAAPYYSAQMTPHAYANLWGGQAQAAMMTPYAAPGAFYPASMYHHHAAMSNPQGTYPGYTAQPTAPAGTTSAHGSTDGNAYRGPQPDGKTSDQLNAVAEPKDEREAKRQRRKQSNRESARRSRLRKQAECEDLGGRVNNLTSENVALREEMNSLTEKVTLLVSDGKELRSQVKDLGGSPPPERVLPASKLDVSKLLNLAEQKLLPAPSKSEDDVGDESGSDDEGDTKPEEKAP